VYVVVGCSYLRGGEEDEKAPLTDKKGPKSVDDGEDGIEQKKKKKKTVQYPLIADVSDAAQIVKFAGIKFLIFFVVFIMGFMVQAMPDKIIICNQQYGVGVTFFFFLFSLPHFSISHKENVRMIADNTTVWL
jgi:hypothetical protein